MIAEEMEGIRSELEAERGLPRTQEEKERDAARRRIKVVKERAEAMDENTRYPFQLFWVVPPCFGSGLGVYLLCFESGLNVLSSCFESGLGVTLTLF